MYSLGHLQTFASVWSAHRRGAAGSSGISNLRRSSRPVAPAILRAMALLAIALPIAYAQTTAGLISGTVTDPQGAAVPEASVAALNQDQKTTVHTNADMAGQFVFPNLLPGQYTITVEAKGFKTLRKVDVVLNANTTVALGGSNSRSEPRLRRWRWSPRGRRCRLTPPSAGTP